MDHRKRFREITDFLKLYQNIWQNEIMVMYPDPLSHYPMSWLQELDSVKDKAALIRLERKEVQGIIRNQELLDFHARIEELCRLEKLRPLPAMPAKNSTWLYMIPKKKYEIGLLGPLINSVYQKNNIKKIVDIGGGIGLLAQTINNVYHHKVISVDLDPVMQETGRVRHEENALGPHKVEYQNIKVSADELRFVQLLDKDTMTLGLHTCGNLANDQMKASTHANAKSVINMGCCYHKLVPETQNISEFAHSQSDKLVMTQFALTLATRAHRKMDETDYDLKEKVKLYRYCIHFLLYDHYDKKELFPLGNSHHTLYDESFGVYAADNLTRNKIPLRHTIEELNAYYNDPARQDLISKMIVAGLVRNPFGRLLELYLQLDRVIYLEENGYEAELIEIFDEPISPRNIAIVATRTDSASV
ncbi:MAG: methyltransferase [Bdellovibrionota bacterium]